jgi:hypothetical protein
VLLIAFNRPEKTERVLEAVRIAGSRRLYLAADGPRVVVPSDADRCERTRRVLDDITWPCRVQRLYRPSNLGCKCGVETAIDWFLAHEESGIILEDDCVPADDFFPFCAELLDRYRECPEVMMIGGHNQLGTWAASQASYMFSRTAPFWGWATWRRAWALYDPAMASWGDPETRAFVRSRMPFIEYRINSQKFDAVYGGRLDSWGYAWTLSMLISDGVSVIPASSLISNIGFDSEATHTKRPSHRAGAVPTSAITWPLQHPASTTPDIQFERALFRSRFPVSRKLLATLPPAVQDRLRQAVYQLPAAERRV